MPEKDCEYVQFKIQEIIYQVKSYGINHSFQTAIPIFLVVHLQYCQLLIKPCKDNR